VGAFKQVYLGLDTQEGKEVAWNTIKLGCLSANDKARVQAEVALLTRLKHKNILVMYDTWVDEEASELYLITSRMANTLKEHVDKLHPLQPAVLKKYCRQILSALAYLHQGVAEDPEGPKKPIIHRDLKCDNIFIDGPTGDVKVGDFGLAEFF
jgi:WNK lysine deficient protein kinase